jgi:hypothetical protein
MNQVRDWQTNREMWIGVLTKQTGEGMLPWMRRIRTQRPRDEQTLRRWLSNQGVTGYAQALLVMEYFGYPDYVLATAEELIERQYEDRQHLRSIYDAIVASANQCGEVIIQARKSYVSLVSPRRTFARVQATTRTRVDLGLRLETPARGRLQPSRIHPTMPVQVGLKDAREVDQQVRSWLQDAFDQNS